MDWRAISANSAFNAESKHLPSPNCSISKAITTKRKTGAMVLPSMTSFDSEPLTAEQSGFKPCANPFCNAPTTAKSGKKFCSDRCRMDGYVLRRARVLLNRVSILECHLLLDRA